MHKYAIDGSSSGFDTDRPEYQALLDHIETGAGDVVLVPNLSHLSRDRKERLRLLLDVDAAGVAVHSVELGRAVDLDDDWALVQQSIRATTDDVEKRKEITRSKRATQERLDNGDDHGQPPFGLTFDDNGHYWIPARESDEYQTARTCIRLREKNHSWRKIARETGVNKDTARRIYDRRERYCPGDRGMIDAEKSPDVTASCIHQPVDVFTIAISSVYLDDEASPRAALDMVDDTFDSVST